MEKFAQTGFKNITRFTIKSALTGLITYHNKKQCLLSLLVHLIKITVVSENESDIFLSCGSGASISTFVGLSVHQINYI